MCLCRLHKALPTTRFLTLAESTPRYLGHKPEGLLFHRHKQMITSHVRRYTFAWTRTRGGGSGGRLSSTGRWRGPSRLRHLVANRTQPESNDDPVPIRTMQREIASHHPAPRAGGPNAKSRYGCDRPNGEATFLRHGIGFRDARRLLVHR